MAFLSKPQPGTTGRYHQHGRRSAVQVQYGRITALSQFNRCPESAPPAALMCPLVPEHQDLIDHRMVNKHRRIWSFNQNALAQLRPPMMQRLHKRKCENCIAERSEAYQKNA